MGTSISLRIANAGFRRRFLAVLALGFALAAFADGIEPARPRPNEGEVLEIDMQAGEITIRHGYLPELDMEPMAMVFRVAHPSFLQKVRKGDRVKFKAGLVEGRFGVTEIERIGRQ